MRTCVRPVVAAAAISILVPTTTAFAATGQSGGLAKAFDDLSPNVAIIASAVILVILVAAGLLRFRTKRREAEERQEADSDLLRSMERYRRLFDRNLAGVVQTDLTGRIRITNTAFASMLHYRDTDELSERSMLDLAVDPEEVGRFFRELNDGQEITNRELALKNRHGEPVFILMNAGRVTESGGDDDQLIEGIAIDISERKRAEDERRRLEIEVHRSTRLESLGVLAGGIAHDFNNSLMAILSNVSLAKRHVSGPTEALDRLKETEEACLRATSLTQQLLTFSKGGRPIRKTASISRLVDEAATFVARGTNCSIDCRTADDLWTAEIDAGQVAQVVQNLVLNAIESMPLGGVTTITADNVHLTEGDVPTLEPGRYLRLEVIDTGGGIAEPELDRIFDPFFTTKKGRSGLGLATAFSIIRSHSGAIVVRSEKGRGSRFSVYIPASEEPRSESGGSVDETLTRQGKLLIMDDDEGVRTAAAELLATIGYAVATASDGAEAVELYRQAMARRDRFDAVVLDLTVPYGVGGRETMSRLLELDPDVKAIVSSGYSSDPVMANYREHGFSGVAVKPYRLADLARTLESIVARSGAS